LDITGGEPFLMPDLLDVLIGLDQAIRVAITSNLSHPLLEFVKHVSPESVINVTARFHPIGIHHASAWPSESPTCARRTHQRGLTL
jgi:hypothetical protein